MKSLQHDALYLALNKLSDVRAIDVAERAQRLVDVGVQLGADIFALEGHGSGRYLLRAFAKIPGELFDVTNARIHDLPARYFLDGAPRNAATLRDCRPTSLRAL